MNNKPSFAMYNLIFLLNGLMMIYSLGAVCTKMAGNYNFLSLHFCMCYAGTLATMLIYAVGWQQIIKKISLTMAYANKAVTVIWGIVWGKLFFGEQAGIRRILGAVIVFLGVFLYATSEERNINDLK